jgi:KaiC/GvpD/RAD55 family RecA-like ATPase
MVHKNMEKSVKRSWLLRKSTEEKKVRFKSLSKKSNSKQTSSSKVKQKNKKKGNVPSIKSKAKVSIPSIKAKVVAKSKPISAKKSQTSKTYKQEFLRTNISGFDALIKQGIPKGSSLLIQGGPGSGKTIFCLTLLKNFCAKGKKVLYMSFEEPEAKLKSHMEGFGVNVEKYEKEKLLYIKRFNALDIARSVEALLSEAKKELLIDVQPVLIPKEFKPDIVLIDSLTSISSAFSGEDSRFRIYMEQLFRYLESHNMTSFLIREVASPTNIGRDYSERGEAVSFLSDGIIILYNVFYHKQGYRKRGIEILKMRGTEIDRKIVECDISKGKGITVQNNRSLTGDYVLT